MGLDAQEERLQLALREQVGVAAPAEDGGQRESLGPTRAAVEAEVPLSYARFSWGGRQAAAARVTTGAWRMRTPRPRDLGHSKQPMETKAIYEARSRRWCPRALVAARPAAVLVIPFISEFAFRYPPHI